FNDPASLEFFPLSLHDALPISPEFRGHEVFDYFCHLVLTRLNIGRWMLTDERLGDQKRDLRQFASGQVCLVIVFVEVESGIMLRSEEHTSELQSRVDLVCRLLL